MDNFYVDGDWKRVLLKTKLYTSATISVYQRTMLDSLYMLLPAYTDPVLALRVARLLF